MARSDNHERDATGTKRKPRAQQPRTATDDEHDHPRLRYINPLIITLSGFGVLLAADGLFGVVLGLAVAVIAMGLFVKRLV